VVVVTAPGTTPDAVAVLRAARSRIADPAAWCAGVMARAADGSEVDPRSTRAVAWCAAAAVERAARDLHAGWHAEHAATRALEGAARLLHGHYLPQEVNDDPELGHAAVVELYDAAIHHLTEVQS